MRDLINFRDFGGYTSMSGRAVRRDCLYRCGQMSNIGGDAVRTLHDLDFEVIADLRYPDERQADPSPWPAHYSVRISAHSGDTSQDAPHHALLRPGLDQTGVIDERYISFYQNLPFDKDYRPLFAEAIQRISQSSGRVLVHCSAGKDRTGLLSALILYCLDVPFDTIIADYMKSSGEPSLIALKSSLIARARKHRGDEISEDVISAVLGVKPTYLESAFSSIRMRFESVDAYLDDMGVTSDVRDNMRERLTQS